MSDDSKFLPVLNSPFLGFCGVGEGASSRCIGAA